MMLAEAAIEGHVFSPNHFLSFLSTFVDISSINNILLVVQSGLITDLQ